jgi:hypothetical protein
VPASVLVARFPMTAITAITALSGDDGVETLLDLLAKFL